MTPDQGTPGQEDTRTSVPGASDPGVSDPGASVTRRSYDNTRRRERAARTRASVHRAAFELFSARGYAGTSLAQIARSAGVSTETVQKMGRKCDLLDGAKVFAVFDAPGLETMADAGFVREVAAQDSFEAAVDVLVDFYATSNRRAARFWQAWRAAALEDAGVASAWRAEMVGAERAFADGIAYAASRGWLRADVDRRELVTTFWVLASAETWTRLTDDAGLDEDAYRRWLRRSMLEQLGTPGLQPPSHR